MNTLIELEDFMLQWADDKQLLKFENSPKQKLKLIEEVGEIARGVLKQDPLLIKDGIGDVFVVLVILAKQLNTPTRLETIVKRDGKNESKYEIGGFIHSIIGFGYNNSIADALEMLNLCSYLLDFDLTECANLAWNEIKDRKGETINGTFIKNE